MRILFLSTWFPYPPNHGGKIRAYNLLKVLAERHRIALVSFQDTPIEPQWLEIIQGMCERVEVIRHDPFHKDPNKKWLGWFSLLPKDVVASYSKEMEQAVRRIAHDWQPDIVVALTFVTARYALNIKQSVRVVDVDNLMTQLMEDAFRQARSGNEWLKRFLAWWKFRRYENWLYRQFDLCLCVTVKDQQKMSELFGIPTSGLSVVPNGAFIENNRQGVISPDRRGLIFNGALTYLANFDAMDYFLKEIYPTICREIPDVTLKITGSTRGVPLELLPKNETVEYTGFLDDIKPVIASSRVCVVPLRVGGGTRIKILEAMSLGIPVVSTVKGAEGLDAIHGEHILIAGTAEEFTRYTIQLLTDNSLCQKLSTQAKHLVEEKYNWRSIQQHFCALIESRTAGRTEQQGEQ